VVHAPINPMNALALWEKREHKGKCKEGIHLPYRVRKPHWVEVRCKVCTKVQLESYKDSVLKEAA
jgi:hypothetical protein